MGPRTKPQRRNLRHKNTSKLSERPKLNIQNLMLIFTGVLEIGLIGIILIGYLTQTIEPTVSIVTSVATVAMALCTAFNVIVTSKQSDSMEAQLNEMRLERRLNDKSLPWAEDIAVIITPPKLYHGCGTECKYFSRYRVNVNICNISQNPILSLDVSARIMSQKGKYDELSSEYISLLPGKAESYKVESMFNGDHESEIYDALREDYAINYPILQIIMTYKTLSEGCFTLTNTYLICPPASEDELESLISWQKSMSTINIVCKNDINDFNTFAQKKMRCEADEAWDRLSQRISEENIRREQIKLSVREVPGSLNIEHISNKEYDKILSNKSYGVPIGRVPYCEAVQYTERDVETK